MKVVAINGSARKDGNTAILINYVFDELQKENIETELVQFAGKNIEGCRACRVCFENKDRHCVNNNDIVNECIDKMLEADGMVIGSPVYFSDVTGNLKSFLERAGYVSRANGDMFKRKVGAAVVAVRRGGAIHTFDSINHFFFIGQMIVPGSIYWNIGIGREKGEVENDDEGVQIMRTLGQNMAWLLKKINE
ncbi:MAG: flavodoxin family protein [Thermoplasmata archaeon]|nr:MAG: flavodoxin family protein [Thermoplasmata archaeon]